jgi:hypothetical protein
MTFEQLLKALEPMVAAELKKLVKKFQPVIEEALAWDTPSRQLTAKLVYKVGCWTVAKAKHVESCPADIKTLMRKYLCSVLKVPSF